MRVLQDLQDFISPFGNWSDLRKAMNQVGYQETCAASASTAGSGSGCGSNAGENGGHQRLSVQSSDIFSSSIHAAGKTKRIEVIQIDYDDFLLRHPDIHL
jgi:hypothetical protein